MKGFFMNYIFAAVIGYLIGCINPAYILGRLKGFDIRTKGSLNAGASNAKITMGWPYFFICLIYDSCKAALSYWLVQKIFPSAAGVGLVGGCAAVMGHIFPFYLQFKGGKGFASLIGVVFFLNWKFGLILGAVSLVAAFLSNWIVGATLVFITVFPIYCIVTHQPVAGIIAVFVACLTILYKHKINFKRIAAGEEIGINGKPAGFHKA